MNSNCSILPINAASSTTAIYSRLVLDFGGMRVIKRHLAQPSCPGLCAPLLPAAGPATVPSFLLSQNSLESHRIDLAPVIDRTGIILWTAAVVELADDGWSNSVSEKDFAQGESPEEAVGALVTKLRRKKAAVMDEPLPKVAASKPKKAKPKRTAKVVADKRARGRAT